MRHTVLFYNPISTSPGKQRLPLSLLAVSAVIAADYDVEFIDANLIADPAAQIIERAKATSAKLLAVTVMPGPQLRQAVPVCKQVKAALPDLTILWGGYFPTQHAEVILNSDCVDYIIQGQGEAPFRTFVDRLHTGGSLTDIPSVGYKDRGEVCVNDRAPNVPLNNLPWFPYDRIDVNRYVGRANYLGTRVLNPQYLVWLSRSPAISAPSSRWRTAVGCRKAPSASPISSSIMHDNWQINGLEFHDMDFFVRRAAPPSSPSAWHPCRGQHQVVGLRACRYVNGATTTPLGRRCRRSGAKMFFMGAESGDDETLKRMNKGGHSGTAMTLALVERMKHYGIVPELSFVLGNPPDPAADIE